MTTESAPRTSTMEDKAATTDASITSAEKSLPLDVVFGILKNRRRRLVLRYLVDVGGLTTLGDLAEHIAAIENNKAPQAITSSERKRVYVGLYQCHLPKMDDAGVIDFRTGGTVELTDTSEQVLRYLDSGGADQTRDWPTYYVALSVVGGGVFVTQRVLYPLDLLSGVIVALLIGLFIKLALEHAFNRGVLTTENGTGSRRSQASPGSADPAQES